MKKAIEIGAFEAKNRLSELLARAENGQRIYITRRGKRVAILTSAEDDPCESTGGSRLFDEIRTFRRNARSGPESLKQLIDEGRRR